MRKKRFFILLLMGGALLLFIPSLSAPAPSEEEIKVITDREYFKVASQGIKEAKHSVQLMMFEASYYEKYPDSPSNLLIQELISARKRGVKVEVILEMGERGERTTQSNRRTAQILAQNGVEVFSDPLFVTTHAKLLIVDGELILLGSSNWTYYALTRNFEANLLIKSRKVAKELQAYFQRVQRSGERIK